MTGPPGSLPDIGFGNWPVIGLGRWPDLMGMVGKLALLGNWPDKRFGSWFNISFGSWPEKGFGAWQEISFGSWPELPHSFLRRRCLLKADVRPRERYRCKFNLSLSQS